jgi:hypothetical protein
MFSETYQTWSWLETWMLPRHHIGNRYPRADRSNLSWWTKTFFTSLHLVDRTIAMQPVRRTLFLICQVGLTTHLIVIFPFQNSDGNPCRECSESIYWRFHLSQRTASVVRGSSCPQSDDRKPEAQYVTLSRSIPRSRGFGSPGEIFARPVISL